MEAVEVNSNNHLTWDQFENATTDQKVDFFKRDGKIFDVLISQQFNRDLLEELIRIADAIRKIAKRKKGMDWLQSLMSHKRAMLYFVQPSTRTFLSFLNACHILGIRSSEVRDPSTSSEVKGETPEDTIRTFSSYVDMIIMRYPKEGFAEKASFVLNQTDRPIPIINAGSGKDQHPTQALLDIYTLHRSFDDMGGIEGKSIAMVGDLLRGRTVRSLSYLLTNYPKVKIYYVSPPQLRMGNDIKNFLKSKSTPFFEVDSIEEILPIVDAVYMTRIQDEWDKNGESKDTNYDRYSLLEKHMNVMKKTAIIMHPLPRRNEIDVKVDSDPRAMYWRQERNGMWIRAALLIKIFGYEEVVMTYSD
ncbi:MAG: aspartate carbamoyltransferase [Candidatus Auribacter fodinae]|jgi:aspartate carbamoyltransferase catalytic subunit|uniref:Aspartate carbamoyltransferase n=1 Tax=Candidatus Auribacter fodinae TaxID=2093366 RepID=A0A3A4QW23_9BACT|nr:MAG: aspartate carbamoyltransferase [Candidatus Auribacter fodinae]